MDEQHSPTPTGTSSRGHGGHGAHGWMMIACCLPMLVIAALLVATGAVSPSFLAVALACAAMMALMMRGMSSGAGADEPGQRRLR